MAAPSARCYVELFDGLASDDRITDALLKVEVGGYAAYSMGGSYDLVVLGRSRLNGADLVTLHTEPISLSVEPTEGVRSSYWRTVTIDLEDIDADAVRCIVMKLRGEGTYYGPEPTREREDQTELSDIPAWGFKLKESTIWASSLRRNVTPERVVEDIVSPYWKGDRFWCPDVSGVECDQLVFESIPFTRLDALQQVDSLLDWDYEATKTRFTYRKPTTLGAARDDELYPVSLADPRFGTTITMAMDECFNGVRIAYSNKNERPKELIRWTESETLGDTQRAKVQEMPDQIRSKKQAGHAADLFLASHKEPPIAGAPTFVQSATVASGEDRDCLLMKPGELVIVNDAPRTYRRQEREISRVTLRPLEHKADVELGAKSRRFEKWLARLDTKRSKE